ncbi:MAG: hypothetical protein AAGK14_10485 [Verrucomicrobiota bacterium]
MKKLLLIPVLASAAFLAPPTSAHAGFNINFSFGGANYGNCYYQNLPVLFRTGYHGPGRIVIVDGRRHWLRPYNERRAAQRQRIAWRNAQQNRRAYREGYRRGARQQAVRTAQRNRSIAAQSRRF